jgi:hypothetical protein
LCEGRCAPHEVLVVIKAAQVLLALRLRLPRNLVAEVFLLLRAQLILLAESLVALCQLLLLVRHQLADVRLDAVQPRALPAHDSFHRRH